MAPLMQAIRTSLEDTILRDNGRIEVYAGNVDSEWTYDNFPHGGFVLGLVVDAAVRFQSKSEKHQDIIQLSAHFLSAVEVGPCKVQIEGIRTGRSFHNLQADFIQKGEVKIRTLLLFGSLATPKSSKNFDKLNLVPPSPFARSIPLFKHPSQTTLAKKIPQARFKTNMQWSFESDPYERNRKLGSSRNEREKEFGELSLRAGGGTLEWAAWYDWTDEDVILDAAIITFFSDVFQRLPDLVSWAQATDENVQWSYTTLSLNIEFKAPIPFGKLGYSPSSVGLYSTSKFMRNGLHDGCVEIWTSPSMIGQGAPTNGWREEQICLAVASQLTIAYPLGDKSKTEKREVKL
jgi:hypothetical protein